MEFSGAFIVCVGFHPRVYWGNASAARVCLVLSAFPSALVVVGVGG